MKGFTAHVTCVVGVCNAFSRSAGYLELIAPCMHFSCLERR